MADPLSVVASSFAVVGVADIVLRTCLKCRQFLSDIEDAPTSIENLQTCLRNNTSLVQTLRNHVQDLESNASAADLVELQPAIDQFDITIKQLRRETDTLFVRCLKYNKMSKKWANVRHVLAERDIRKTTEQMERAKATLSVVLSLIEGYVRSEDKLKEFVSGLYTLECRDRCSEILGSIILLKRLGAGVRCIFRSVQTLTQDVQENICHRS
jgi:hypothetical protein